jgi:hypothetical protein
VDIAFARDRNPILLLPEQIKLSKHNNGHLVFKLSTDDREQEIKAGCLITGYWRWHSLDGAMVCCSRRFCNPKTLASNLDTAREEHHRATRQQQQQLQNN